MTAGTKTSPNSEKIREVMTEVRKQAPALVLFSLLVNLLLLASAIYMLQIYDRVLSSGSLDTLLWLTFVALFAVVIYGFLEQARRLILSRIGGWLDSTLSGSVVQHAMEARLLGKPGEAGPRDVADLRVFLGGEPVLAFLDAPWSVIFIAFIWMLHPALGVFATAGALALFLAALANDFLTRRKQGEVGRRLHDSHARAVRYIDSGETLMPLGMVKGLIGAWQASEDRNRADEQHLKETTNLILSFSRSLRLLLQIGILGLGAFYVLEAQLTAGAMIAASIVLGRALAPIERSITAWRRFTAARLAKNRLEQLFGLIEGQPPAVTLPRPTGALELDAVSYQEPRSGEPILRGVGFTLKPGETCAVIGPSGSGKSSLCRLLVGAWKPTLGCVRLDGAEVFDWISANLAPYIGYLPQQVELFPGSVAENIARFGPLDSDMVIAAAKLAGVHELILELPQGYETEVDMQGSRISLGQRQRIALARALYDDPVFIVLDEPNSNLDSAGDQALTRALLTLKKRGRTIVIVTHRPAALETADKVLLLREGSVAKFGERDEVLRLVMGRAPKSQGEACDEVAAKGVRIGRTSARSSSDMRTVSVAE